MTYYRVKPEHQDRKVKDRFLVRNELYTPSEMKRFTIPVEFTEEISISRKRTYWLFGARFEFDKGFNYHEQI